VGAGNISEVIIATGDGTGPGFYDELVGQTGQTDLSSWCQVYDLRFRNDQNNIGWTGQAQEDVITIFGANNDTDLYRNFLNEGGSVYLQGEHTDYYIRNTNMLMFINSMATSPITQVSPSVIGGAGVVNVFSCASDNYCNDYNVLTGGSLSTNWAGGIQLASIGSALPLVTNPTIGAMMMGWTSNELVTTGGRLAVGFETNTFAEAVLANATSTAVLQNLYDFLSTGCRKYEVTKEFVPPQLCVGDPGTFEICYENTGSRAITNIDIWDTIPTCLSYTGASLAPTSTNGNVYSWRIANIPAGASACITVNFDTTSFPPCP
jgi:uncharacterized repeat protein (TIGR01451 family)